MASQVYCNGCGQRVEVPPGYTRTKLRCPECGVFNELPKEVRDAAGLARAPAAAQDEAVAALLEPESVARPARSTPPAARVAPPEKEEEVGVYGFQEEPKPKAASKPAVKPETIAAKDVHEEREVLIHGTEEDDGNPYRVTGDAPTKLCPECDKKVPKKATTCVECGFHFESGKKAERTYQPVDREWEAGWPFQKRLMLFVVLQVINFATLVASLIMGHGVGISFTLVLMTVGMQAFVCGTFDRLTLTRNQKGKVVLTRMMRYAFIPRLPESIRWKEHEGVTMTRENDFDLVAWVFVFILLGYGCLPGIAFWYIVVRPDKFTVALTKDHGSPETPIFRTTSEERAREVLEVVSDVTTLPLQS